MELVKFMQSGEYHNGGEFGSEVYINPNKVFYVRRFIDNEFNVKYPISTTIYFGDDDKIRVDGIIEEIIAKLNGGE